MLKHEHVCAACATHGIGSYCTSCGRSYHLGSPSWQDGVYLGGAASIHRRGATEIRRVLPLLLAPFKHLDAIPHPVWRFALFVAFLGVAPLVAIEVLGANDHPSLKFWSLGLYFSLLWAAFFAALFHTSGIRLRLAIGSYLGTIVGGVVILQVALMLNLEALRDSFLDSQDLWISAPSFVAFVGVPEELCKALVLFAIWRWAGLPMLRPFIYYGLLSGLGFGIAEGIGYQRGEYLAYAQHTGNFIEYYFVSVLRLTSLPLLHAAWTGTAAYLLWFAIRVRTASTGLFILAIGLPAVLHGLYDALSPSIPWLSVAIGAASVSLLAIYIASITQLEEAFSVGDDHPTAVR